ncbi:MAG TPA: hypothetical protein VFQ24_15715 [Terriglobia bacterium]|nr:hypothetical protein [Terriglobia bacterium]
MEAESKAKEAELKAIQLDDSLGEAHYNLAASYFWHDWDWAAAEKEFQRALELNPNLAEAHGLYGWYLVAVGRIHDGLVQNRRALELDPLSPGLNTFTGQSLYFAHQYDQAIEQLQKSNQLDPNYWVSHDILGWVYLEMGHSPEAIEEFKHARWLVGDAIAEPAASLGYAYAVSGQRDKAERMIAELQSKSKQTFVSPFMLAMIYTGLGEKNRAFHWLDKAYVERSWFWRTLQLIQSLTSCGQTRASRSFCAVWGYRMSDHYAECPGNRLITSSGQTFWFGWSLDGQPARGTQSSDVVLIRNFQ